MRNLRFNRKKPSGLRLSFLAFCTGYMIAKSGIDAAAAKCLPLTKEEKDFLLSVIGDGKHGFDNSGNEIIKRA